ncbi:START domain-containing protein 10-like [Homarus americanus]|uniref:START domain-containing protein 10-like n=1 Tax=Homarus americanus TaxID=6706 RepID=A0A8J5MLG9_HOMAM|nr:START domain-containing protein 10-like [Homarus americanus]
MKSERQEEERRLEVRVADDRDFERLKQLCDCHDGWSLAYDHPPTKVYTRPTKNSTFQMIKVCTVYSDIDANVLYDVLHDPHYRQIWDKHMIHSVDVGYLNPNNDVSYYASYLIRPLPSGGCTFSYVSHCDPRGKLPPWLVNKLTHVLAPKMVKTLLKASRQYLTWKAHNNPNYKPWIYPEQINLPRIAFNQCTKSPADDIVDIVDESQVDEKSLAHLSNDDF